MEHSGSKLFELHIHFIQHLKRPRYDSTEDLGA